jgi:hypothetical protein
MAGAGAGKFAPLLVAILVILILLIQQPLQSEILGFPGNLFASAIVALGGLLGTLRE